MRCKIKDICTEKCSRRDNKRTQKSIKEKREMITRDNVGYLIFQKKYMKKTSIKDKRMTKIMLN